MIIKKIISISMILSLLLCVPVSAAEINSVNTDKVAEMESIKFVEQKPMSVSMEKISILNRSTWSVQSRTVTQDRYEPNNTPETACPYSRVSTITSKITNTNQLYTLGMKNAGLHSATDEDWYTINLTAGEEYFVDLRNVGNTNWYIELYYIRSDGSAYFYTTNPEYYPVYEKKPEKYFYFTAEDSGKYYIRITSGNDWVDKMYYYFYVGPVIQYFNIDDMPTNGSVKMWGDDYQTYTCNMHNVVPAQSIILDLSISDNFPDGGYCGEVEKYMKAGGKTYYASNSGSLNGISGASLRQVWTIGARCASGSHFIYWSGNIDGRFACLMEPYPGNELDF